MGHLSLDREEQCALVSNWPDKKEGLIFDMTFSFLIQVEAKSQSLCLHIFEKNAVTKVR